MKKLFKKGFTLVELLVVIAILAILAGVSVVGYLSFTQKARESRAQSELVQIRDYLTASLVTTTEDDDVYIDQAEGYISVTLAEAAANEGDVIEAIATAADTAEDLPIFDDAAVSLYGMEGTAIVTGQLEYKIAYVVYEVDGGSAYWTVKDGAVETYTEGMTLPPVTAETTDSTSTSDSTAGA